MKKNTLRKRLTLSIGVAAFVIVLALQCVGCSPRVHVKEYRKPLIKKEKQTEFVVVLFIFTGVILYYTEDE